MNKETLKRIGIPVAAVIASVGLGFAGITSAQTASTSGATGTVNMRGMARVRPAAVGKVTAISGTKITVSSTNPKDNTVTTYVIDASAASVEKGSAGVTPAAATLADIAVGDTVMVQGTTSGTSIIATKILDGIMARGGMGMMGRGGPGEHGMGARGTVTSVSGSTITVTGKDGTSYTVNAGSATVSKQVDIAVSDIKVGDEIDAQGTVSGTTVTATRIMDGIPKAPTQMVTQ
jgi:hypothetical protein